MEVIYWKAMEIIASNLDARKANKKENTNDVKSSKSIKKRT
jgi:hypothetical protein